MHGADDGVGGEFGEGVVHGGGTLNFGAFAQAVHDGFVGVVLEGAFDAFARPEGDVAGAGEGGDEGQDGFRRRDDFVGFGADFVIREVAPGADRAQDAIEKILAGAGGDVDEACEGAGCLGRQRLACCFALGANGRC